MVFGTCANSSRKIMLKEDPRTAEPEVADANIFEPFSSSIFPNYMFNHFPSIEKLEISRFGKTRADNVSRSV